MAGSDFSELAFFYLYYFIPSALDRVVFARHGSLIIQNDIKQKKDNENNIQKMSSLAGLDIRSDRISFGCNRMYLCF